MFKHGDKINLFLCILKKSEYTDKDFGQNIGWWKHLSNLCFVAYIFGTIAQKQTLEWMQYS